MQSVLGLEITWVRSWLHVKNVRILFLELTTSWVLCNIIAMLKLLFLFCWICDSVIIIPNMRCFIVILQPFLCGHGSNIALSFQDTWVPNEPQELLRRRRFTDSLFLALNEWHPLYKVRKLAIYILEQTRRGFSRDVVSGF